MKYPGLAGVVSPSSGRVGQAVFFMEDDDMLVLGRKKNDKVLIVSPDGTQVIVTVVRTKPLRLGFEAPDDVGIFRAEAAKKIDKKQPVEAAKT